MTNEVLNMVKHGLSEIKFYFGYGMGQEETDKTSNMELNILLRSMPIHQQNILWMEY